MTTNRHENLPLPSPSQQIGGNHYKSKAIQPITYATAKLLSNDSVAPNFWNLHGPLCINIQTLQAPFDFKCL